MRGDRAAASRVFVLVARLRTALLRTMRKEGKDSYDRVADEAVIR